MKIQNIFLINYDNILSQFSEKKLPQKISFAITKNLLLIAKELEPYQKSLSNIIKSYDEYIEKDDKGEQITLPIGVPKVDDKHINDYLKEIDELLQIEIDFDFYYIDDNVFDYDDNGKYDPMSAKDIIMLRDILCKGDDNEKAER